MCRWLGNIVQRKRTLSALNLHWRKPSFNNIKLIMQFSFRQGPVSFIAEQSTGPSPPGFLCKDSDDSYHCFRLSAFTDLTITVIVTLLHPSLGLVLVCGHLKSDQFGPLIFLSLRLCKALTRKSYRLFFPGLFVINAYLRLRAGELILS